MIRPGGNRLGLGIRCHWKLGEAAGWGHASYLGHLAYLGKPEVTIRPGGNRYGGAVGHRAGYWKLGEAAGWGHASYLGHTWLGKPEVTIRPGGNRFSAIRRWQWKLGEVAGWGHASYLGIATSEVRLGKPEIAIWPGGNRLGHVCSLKLGDAASGSHASYIAATIQGKPEVAIWPGDNRLGVVIIPGYRKHGDGSSGGDPPYRGHDRATPYIAATTIQGKPEVSIRSSSNPHDRATKSGYLKRGDDSGGSHAYHSAIAIVVRPANQRLPSVPVAIPEWSLLAGNSVMVPVITGVVVLVPVAGVVLLIADRFLLLPEPQANRRGMIHPSRHNRTNLRAILEEVFMMILSLITTDPLSRMISLKFQFIHVPRHSKPSMRHRKDTHWFVLLC